MPLGLGREGVYRQVETPSEASYAMVRIAKSWMLIETRYGNHTRALLANAFFFFSNVQSSAFHLDTRDIEEPGPRTQTHKLTT